MGYPLAAAAGIRVDRDGVTIENMSVKPFPGSNAWDGLLAFCGAMKLHNGITDIGGIEVGHYTDLLQGTGCTVILCRQGAVGGVDVRGGAPGTRETDLLHPSNQVQRLHAILLTGGSAYGLAAAGGVMQYLEEQGVGYAVGAHVVPIIPAAVLFDLNFLAGDVRPGPDDGLQACRSATSDASLQGTVGAGTGATVGKALGMGNATKGGIGSASITLPDGIVLAALVAVNAYGGVTDHHSGQIIAGPRCEVGPHFHDTNTLLLEGRVDSRRVVAGENTSIGVVATNATLDKPQADHLARVSHDGLALTIRPCHTPRDGDTMFAMATCASSAPVDLTQLGAAAVEVTAQAVLNAVFAATGLGGIPSSKEWRNV